MDLSNLEKKLKHYRISLSEYESIKKLLNRELKEIEWPLFSALWSEHCSYKSSKVHLRKFSYRNNSTRDDSEENAGVVDLGFGEKIIFKMESHNHPSYIEPFQGAATGVGGILRDIFTMGARPIALADYLCFGKLNYPRMKYLEQEVVHGISSYGNCVGVPTITGYTEYDESYNENILVNAMAVGLLTQDMKLASSKSYPVVADEKNKNDSEKILVVYVGAKTGKDGVHGAAMASESFSDDTESKKPNIQIGDPFFEKLLIESCLEVLDADLVLSMQDMGAAGLTSSSFEMAAKGGVGFDIHLDLVPSRDSTLTAEEILLSESQERMLLTCTQENLKKIQKQFKKWSLDAEPIGVVNQSKKMRLFWKGDCLTEIDPSLIVDSAPKYNRPFDEIKLNPIHVPNSNLTDNRVKSHSEFLDVTGLNNFNFKEAFQKLCQDEFFSSKSWIYEQYDQRVGARTVKDASHSLAIIRLPSHRDLAVTVGTRPSFMRLNAQLGAADGVWYQVLQQAIKGFKPLAITDCLNFGNPEKKNVMTDFVASVEVIAEIAKIIDAPVISGNVSFYNETKTRNITPTPALGMIAIKENDQKVSECFFNDEFLEVFLLQVPMITSLAKVSEVLNIKPTFWGSMDFEVLNGVRKSLEKLALEVKPKVARVVGQGGLAMSLKKMSDHNNSGIHFQAFHENFFKEQRQNFLFEERLYEFVFAVEKNNKESFYKELNDRFGKTGSVHYLGYTEKKPINFGIY